MKHFSFVFCFCENAVYLWEGGFQTGGSSVILLDSLLHIYIWFGTQDTVCTEGTKYIGYFLPSHPGGYFSTK